MIHLAPKLNSSNLDEAVVLKHFGRLLRDEQAGIRTNTTVCIVIGCMALAVTGLYFWATNWKRNEDRSQTLIHIRNSQQAMRGVRGMDQLAIGDPFTREDLEHYMKFPADILNERGVMGISA